MPGSWTVRPPRIDVSRHLTATLAALAATAIGSGCSPDHPPAASRTEPVALRAPLIRGLGSHRHPITTSVPMTQRLFDQGLLLAWAFDYPEAARSFREAARLDPACAMCEWGIAYASGRNINNPFAASATAARHAARAQALSANASARERAYIGALSLRYGLAAAAAISGEQRGKRALCGPARSNGAAEPHEQWDRQYAEAMGAVARAYPDDPDALALHAEAMMMLAPWDWWDKAGTPRAATPAAERILERILARDRRHPAANHFYVHLLEASPYPERALGAASRLERLLPGAAHLVHMPAHIYMRIGRYHDATRVNQAAIEADLRLSHQLREQGFEPLSHHAHHHHFLWAAAAMEGRSEIAFAAAAHLAAIAARPGEPFGADGSNHYYLALPLLAQVRFQRWSEILASSEPHGPSFVRGIWLFARGMAEAASGDTAAATRRLQALARVRAEPVLETQSLKGIDTLAALIDIASATLRGTIELAQRNFDAAVASLEAAVRLESQLEDEEPPAWLGPARHALGGALLAAARGHEAERVFREDLRRNPANGWGLFGLARSVRLQGDSVSADQVAAAASNAWRHADIPPPF